MATAWSVPPDLFKNRKVAILATGPSLTEQDCASVRDAGYATVAINNACYVAPWCDLLHACDSKWWNYHRDFALTLPCIKTTLDDCCAYPAVNWLRWREGNAPSGVTLGYSDDPTLVRTGGNSGYQAIHIAAQAGAKDIVLLGFDMRVVGNMDHFFGKHPDKLGTEVSPYAEFAKAFDSLAPELAKRGVKVVNCTEGSAITAFPKVTLSEILACHKEGRSV